jgi:DNA ligase-1
MRDPIHPGIPAALSVLLGLAHGLPVQAAVAAPALLLARVAPPGQSPAGYLVSEKFDGVRALWDGRRLRLRGGGEVKAPSWFLAGLPQQALDGELWLGRGRFDDISALVRREQPVDADWREVRYLVFELPGAGGSFAERAVALHALVAQAGRPGLQAVDQVRLPGPQALAQRLAEVVALGGEGLVLHRADAPYVTGRSDVLLKLKPVQDADAVVMAHEPGQGKYAGMVGALVVRDADGRVFRIGSGLSDAQRRSPPPLGSTVSYRWRGLTATGLPRFATLWRVREPGL